MKTKRLTKDAMLTAAALIIFIVEAQIPLPVSAPGLKLGLANVITLYAMFALGPRDALAILLCRVFLGSLFSGRVTTFIYSACGGMACYLLTLLLRPMMGKNQIWLCGLLGALAHNIGQVAAAVAVTSTPSLVVYLPPLMIAGAFTGSFTGMCAQLVINRKDLPR